MCQVHYKSILPPSSHRNITSARPWWPWWRRVCPINLSTDFSTTIQHNLVHQAHPTAANMVEDGVSLDCLPINTGSEVSEALDRD